MKSLKIAAITIIFFAMASGCNNNKDNFKVPESKAESVTGNVTTPTQYDPNRGEGKYNFDNLNLKDKLDTKMADAGQKIVEAKCYTCHKPTEERLVGPGWKDITRRRTGHWLMNYMVNPGPMLDKDENLKKEIEICNVRMPNQALTDQNARDILEFMRKNDGLQ